MPPPPPPAPAGPAYGHAMGYGLPSSGTINPVNPQDSTELRAAEEGAFTGTKSTFHPYAGGAILGVDWAAWGAIEAPTGGLLMAVSMLGSFLLAFALVFNIQRNLNHDSFRGALVKALLGGIVAGLPFPIAGTAVGTLILLASGLPVAKGAAGVATSLLTGGGKSVKK